MNYSEIKNRISDMETDIFPLDRMLPLSSVYKIFKYTYESIKDKNLLFRNRSYQRLREGYAGLFVAVSLNRAEQAEHFLTFPKDASNDITITSFIDKSRNLANKLLCDVKEFTNFSGEFNQFVQRKVVPKLEVYNIIIFIYKPLNRSDLENLLVTMKGKKGAIWLVSSPDQRDQSYDLGKVTIIMDNDYIAQYDIDLSKGIVMDVGEPIIVYQNVLRDKFLR